MHPFAYVLVLSMALVSFSTQLLNDSVAEAVAHRRALMANVLKVYGGALATYVHSNPSVSGTISDSAGSVPTWLKRPSGMTNVASGGKIYAFVPVTDRAEGMAIAAQCGEGVTCGFTVSGQIVVPGQAASAGPTPSGVPSNGAVVLVY
ncbi:type IV pilus biogenesis protein PilM [Xanthomonas euvesicatoria]